MALASLTVDLSLGLAKFEGDAGKAAQIMGRSAGDMARSTEKADAAVRKLVQSYGQFGVESKIISAAAAGASDSALKLFASVDAGVAAFARVGAQGSAAFKAIGASSEQELSAAQARILQLADKVRQVKDQSSNLTKAAGADRESGKIDDDGLKQRLATIRTVEKSELERIANVARADAEARRAARAENISSAKSAVVAQGSASTATAAAQSQVYAAFLIAEAAAAEKAAQAEARQAEVANAVAAATDRARASQQAAYETKTAFIAKVNEEAAALFRTKDAQRQLDAERAGVGSQQAAQLAKLAGDREFISTIYEQIAAEQKLADQFGKTAAEILRQEAAARGLTNTTASAIGRFEALATSNKKVADSAATTKGNDAFIQSLEREANAIGKSRSELLALEAAQRGVGNEAAAAIAKISAFDGKTGQLGKSSYASANQLRTLQYTIGDVAASAASGISPLTILLQQGGQVIDAFTGPGAQGGGTGAFFKGLLSFITPFRVAVGGAAAAVAALGYAFYEGDKQSKAFSSGLLLSGGFAGKTEGQFNAVAKAVAASGQVTIGAAREVAQALANTGEIGPQVFNKATEAAALYGKATGQNASEVAKDFAAMAGDAAKWAADHNRSLNFITSAQYEQIKSLQELGKTAEAQGLLYDLLTDRFKKVDQNLGVLGKTLQEGKNLWSRFWDAAFDIGRAETIEGKIAKLQAKISAPQLNEQVATDSAGGAAFIGPKSGRRGVSEAQRQAAQSEIVALQSDQGLIEQATAEKARRAELAKLNIAFDATAQAYRLAAKAGSEKKKARTELEAFFDRRQEEGNPVSAQDKADSIKGLNKKFEDTKGAGEADAQRKSNLAKALAGFKAELSLETDALKFHQDELAAIYAQGNTSLTKFYDDKVRTTAQGVAQQLAAQQKETDRLRQELTAGKFKDPHERTDVEKQLNESLAKSANLVRDADHAATLAVYERAAAFKTLAKEVQNFEANLLQQQGDDLGASRLRNAQALRDALEFARKATPLQSTGDVAREERRRDAGTSLEQKAQEQARLNEVAAQFAEIQKRVGIATSDAARAEELFLLRSKQSGDSLLAQEQGVYAIRAASLAQLGAQRDAALEAADAEDKIAAAQGRVADPKYTAAAKDLALAYAKAAEAVDPALTRLRAAGDEAGASLANIFANATTKATSFKDLLSSIGGTIRTVLVKTLVTEPLTKSIQGGIRTLLDGGNPLAKFFKSGAGASTQVDGSGTNLFVAEAAKAVQVEAQTLAVVTSTSALQEFTAAVSSSVNTLRALNGDKVDSSGTNLFGSDGPKVDNGSVNLFAADAKAAASADERLAAEAKANAGIDGLTQSLVEARSNAQDFSALLPKVGSFLNLLGNSGQQAAGALSILPNIIRLIESAAGSGSSGSGLGSIISLATSFFGGGSGLTVDTGGFSTNLPGISLPTKGGAAGGTNFVERDMLTIIHQGEAVVPKAFNPYGGNVRPQVQRPEAGSASGKTGGDTFVTVNNNGDAKATTKESRRSNGDREIEILIEQVVANSVNSGGTVHDSISRRYGVNAGGTTPRY